MRIVYELTYIRKTAAAAFPAVVSVTRRARCVTIATVIIVAIC